MSDHLPPTERTGLFATPLPRFLLKWWLPAEAWPLYLRLTGYGYARPDAAQRWFLFHWTRLLALPFIFPAVWLAMTTGNPQLQIAGGAAALLCMAVAGGGMVVPQPFPPWLAKAGRDGFLADLALTKLKGKTIIQCHYLARAAPVACFFLPFVVLFYSMFLIDIRNLNQYWNEYLYFYAIFLFGMTITMKNQSMPYYLVVRHGTNSVRWIIKILFSSTTSALFITAFVIAMCFLLDAMTKSFMRPYFIYYAKGDPYFNKIWIDKVHKSVDHFFIFFTMPLQLFVAYMFNQKVFRNLTLWLSAEDWSACVARELGGGKGAEE